MADSFHSANADASSVQGYTPGPWHGPVNTGLTRYEIHGKTRRIAVVDTIEDARLVLAAPELLEALKAIYEGYCSTMRSEFDFPGRPWTPERDNDETAMRARAAIAKATGATP